MNGFWHSFVKALLGIACLILSYFLIQDFQTFSKNLTDTSFFNFLAYLTPVIIPAGLAFDKLTVKMLLFLAIGMLSFIMLLEVGWVRERIKRLLIWISV